MTKNLSRAGITDLRVQLHRKRHHQQQRHDDVDGDDVGNDADDRDDDDEANDSLENADFDAVIDVDSVGGEKYRTALSGNRYYSLSQVKRRPIKYMVYLSKRQIRYLSEKMLNWQALVFFRYLQSCLN